MGPTCEVCGRVINTVTDAYYQHMEGWAKSRSQGGPNALSKPTRSDRFRCNTCFGAVGRDEAQLVMFD
jgi:hypothetical protein